MNIEQEAEIMKLTLNTDYRSVALSSNTQFVQRWRTAFCLGEMKRFELKEKGMKSEENKCNIIHMFSLIVHSVFICCDWVSSKKQFAGRKCLLIAEGAGGICWIFLTFLLCQDYLHCFSFQIIHSSANGQLNKIAIVYVVINNLHGTSFCGNFIFSLCQC